MTPVQGASLALALPVATAALAWAAASDFSRYLIPNRAVALVALAYLGAALAMPVGDWVAGAGAGAAVLAVGAALFSRGWVGGGDVKLAAATALWAGPAFFSEFALATSLAGAVLAALMLSPAGRLAPKPAGHTAAAQRFRQPLPFGVPLAAGGLWVLALQASARF